MALSVKIDSKGFVRELMSPRGAMGIDLMRRARRVRARARQLAPRDTGRLVNSISIRFARTGGFRLAVTVRASAPYAKFQHDGTGIYGPRKRMIVARPGKVFVFRSKTTGDLVFATKIRGTPATKFLERALPAAAG